MLTPKMSHLSTRKKSGEVLTSYLGLRDEQLSPPGGRGSCEEKKEKGVDHFLEESLRDKSHVLTLKIKYIYLSYSCLDLIYLN